MMLARRLQLNASTVVGHVGSLQKRKQQVTDYAGNTNMQKRKQSIGMGLGVSV